MRMDIAMIEEGLGNETDHLLMHQRLVLGMTQTMILVIARERVAWILSTNNCAPSLNA